MPDIASASKVDVRLVRPRDRHPTVFLMFRDLKVEEAMDVINDHDPSPLIQEMGRQFPGQFTSEYLEQGPDDWRVRVTRTASAHGNGQCCGSCGGQ
ncbi:DUF2249 domain-containing protein [Roseateles sp.]|uniref:DUF2249 domain-containing protein n=1 Tax=Roseateles sp. TaxID=1971397 RepID=UPI0032647CE8